MLHATLRQAAHTLPASEEALLASVSDPLAQPKRIFEQLNGAELPWPTVTVRGKKVVLDDETFIAMREDRDPKVREQLFKAFFPVYQHYQGTIGAIYVAHLKGEVFSARAHKFDTALQARLADTNTPEAVYRTLVAEANAGLPTLQRYLKLRARLLGLKELKYSDNYAAFVKPPRTYTLAEAEALTLQASRRWARTTRRRSRSTSRKAGWTPCRARASAPAPTSRARPTTCIHSCC